MKTRHYGGFCFKIPRLDKELYLVFGGICLSRRIVTEWISELDWYKRSETWWENAESHVMKGTEYLD